MTNLEAKGYRISNKAAFCLNAHICKYGKNCAGKKCFDCEFDNNVNECIKAMLSEYIEPIKLKQWEYDTIKYHGKLSKFNDIHFLMAMKNKGYFKDMNSVEKCSMTIKEILDNCEVIE